MRTEQTPLISAASLNQLRGRQDVKVFDVRGTWNGNQSDAIKAYERSHIPGAVFLDYTRHFVAQDCAIQLASVADLDSANHSFKELGINKNDTVILYDDYNHVLASRIWWAMRQSGFNRVKILDGGLKSWIRSEFPLSSVLPSVSPGDYKSDRAEKLRIEKNELLAIKSHVHLIDGRGINGYKGSPDNPRSGHIPNAINIPYTELLDPSTGLFRPKEELKSLFHSKIPDLTEKQIISSCGSGYAGSVILVGLYIIGIKAPLFDDSFAGWQNDPSLPVEQGPYV